MNKTEALKDWLIKMQEHHSKSETIADRLYKDGFRQIAGYLEREGYEKTKAWLDKRLLDLSTGNDSKLKGMLDHFYNQAKQKMWNIERKAK